MLISTMLIIISFKSLINLIIFLYCVLKLYPVLIIYVGTSTITQTLKTLDTIFYLIISLYVISIGFNYYD